MIKIYFILMLLLSVGFFGVRFVFSEAIKTYFDWRMYLSFAVILAAGFVLYNALMFILIAGAVLLVTVKSRIDALCRLAILVAVTPNVQEFVTVGNLYLTAISAPVVLGGAALIACYVCQGSQRDRKLTVEDALVFLLILCFGIGAARGSTFTGVQRAAVTIALDLGLPYFVYRRFVQGRVEFAYVVATLAGAAMILAFIGICEAKMHWSIFDPIYGNYGDQFLRGFISRNSKVRGGFLRAPASFSDSTAFALFEVTGFFAVVASRRFFRSDLLWSGSIALTLLGLIAAQSRGADVGLLFGLFCIMAVRRRYALAAAVAGGGATILALMLVLASSSPMVAAFVGGQNHAGVDVDYRQTLLRRGLQVGMEHPILGNDMTKVIAEMSDITQGEGLVDLVNTYLTIFLNSGLVGLGLFIALIATIFIKIFRWDGKKEDQSFIDLQMFVAGALSGGLMTLTFTTFNYERNPFWIMMILACGRSLTSKTRSSLELGRSQLGQSTAASEGYLVHRWQPNLVIDPV